MESNTQSLTLRVRPRGRRLEALVHEVSDAGDDRGAQRVGLAAQVGEQHRDLRGHDLREGRSTLRRAWVAIAWEERGMLRRAWGAIAWEERSMLRRAWCAIPGHAFSKENSYHHQLKV